MFTKVTGIEDKILNLRLHESIDISGTNMNVTRIVGGLVYSFYNFVNVYEGNEVYQYNHVFVPFTFK